MKALPLFVLSVLAPAIAAAAPTQVHLSWQGRTDTTMTVTWRSTDATGSVQFGADTGYGQSSTAQSTAFSGSYLHVAELTGLTPGTTYHYRCGTSGSWSTDATFATAPAAGMPFRFVAWGDSRSDDTLRAQVRAAVQARAPAFTVDTGDLVDDGSVQPYWDQFFATLEPLARSAPLMVAVGNHEANATNYYAQFALPKHPAVSGYADEAFYSFDYASVHLVALTTEATVGGAQTSWLADDLAAAKANPNIRWIVAYAHRPPYSNGVHGSDLTVRSAWTPLFEQYGVDLAFFGHDHDYERTKSLLGSQPVSSGGVTYVVTGGAGAPLYGVGSDTWTAFSDSRYHFIELNVTADQLRMDARDVSLNVFDTLTLTKPIPPDAGTPPPPDASTPPPDASTVMPDASTPPPDASIALPDAASPPPSDASTPADAANPGSPDAAVVAEPDGGQSKADASADIDGAVAALPKAPEVLGAFCGCTGASAGGLVLVALPLLATLLRRRV